MQAGDEAQGVDPVERLDGDLGPPHPGRQRLGEEVEAPRGLGGDGQQLGVVGRLGQALGGEAQGRERQPLLEVAGGAAPGDRRDLVVTVGALGVVRQRRVVEHRRPAHGLEAALVEATALASEQLVDDGVGDEGVGEPELVVADLDARHPRRRQRAQGGAAGRASSASVTTSSASNDAARP